MSEACVRLLLINAESVPVSANAAKAFTTRHIPAEASDSIISLTQMTELSKPFTVEVADMLMLIMYSSATSWIYMYGI